MIDDLKPNVQAALGAAIMAVAVVMLLSALFWPHETAARYALASALAFCIVWGGVMALPIGPNIVIALDATRLARARMGEDIARHELAAAKSRQEEVDLIGRGVVAPADTPTLITIDNAPRYKADWNSYFLEALEYARAVGSVGYQKTKAFFGNDVVVWRTNFAVPFIRAGIIRPIQPGVETAFEDGLSIDKAVWRVENGTGPTAPPWPPPVAFSGRSASGTGGNGQELRKTAAQTE